MSLLVACLPGCRFNSCIRVSQKKTKKQSKTADKKVNGEGAEKEPAKKKGKKPVAPEVEGDDDAPDEEKPRIKIKISADKKTKAKSAKRKPSDLVAEDGDVSADGNAPTLPITKKRAKKDPVVTKRRGKKAATPTDLGSSDQNANDGASDQDGSAFLDVAPWKNARLLLSGSFDAARGHFTKNGPWILPPTIDDDSFPEIALATLAKMDK